MLTVESTTATTISLSWTSAGSVVDSYEVMWERDTSGECPDEDEGNTAMTGNFTNYTITELEEYSNYTISVKANNNVGSIDSEPIFGFTDEGGNYILIKNVYLINLVTHFSFSSLFLTSLFC